VERRHALLVEPNIEEKMVLDTDRLSAIQDAPHIEYVCLIFDCIHLVDLQLHL
jgi:hypothetical protein